MGLRLRAHIRKAVERASLEALKDKAAGYKFPRSLIKALAPPYHDLEEKKENDGLNT